MIYQNGDVSNWLPRDDSRLQLTPIAVLGISVPLIHTLRNKLTSFHESPHASSNPPPLVTFREDIFDVAIQIVLVYLAFLRIGCGVPDGNVRKHHCAFARIPVKWWAVASSAPRPDME